MSNHDVQIWNNAKARFLAEQAYYWILSNKILEFLLLIGIVIFFAFDSWFKYVGIAVSLYSISSIFYRFGLYDGFYDGYENGYTDCEAPLIKIFQKCDEKGRQNDNAKLLEFAPWASLNPEVIPDYVIKACTLNEIVESWEWSEKDKQDYAKRQVKGLKQLIGWILTWRKLKKDASAA